jgi:uncharacterized protein YndB with AHSA1/START domain
MEVYESVEIAAPPGKIWPFLVEPDNILKWCITFRRFEYKGEQHAGPGTRFYVEEKAGGPLMRLNFEATEWKENEALDFRMTSGTGVRSYRQRWTLEPTSAGSRFSFAEEVGMPFGVVGRLLGTVMRGSSERHVGEMLGKLKTLVEAQQSGG